MTSYYQLFDISEEATEKDIKRAFKSLAMRYHPDKNPDNLEAGEIFKRLNTAYQILINPQQRALYDQRLAYTRFLESIDTEDAIITDNYTNTVHNPNAPITYHGAYTTYYAKGKYPKGISKRKPESKQFFWTKIAFLVLFLGGTFSYIGYIEFDRYIEKKEAHKLANERITKANQTLTDFQKALTNKELELAEILLFQLQRDPYASSFIENSEQEFTAIIWEQMVFFKSTNNINEALGLSRTIEKLNLKLNLPVNQFTYNKLIYDCQISQGKLDEAVRDFTLSALTTIDKYNTHFEIAKTYEQQNETHLASYHFTQSSKTVFAALKAQYGDDYAANPELFISEKQADILVAKSKNDYVLEQFNDANRTLHFLLLKKPKKITAWELLYKIQIKLNNTDEANEIKKILSELS